MPTKVINQAEGDTWKLYHGDSCEVLKGIPDCSIDFGIHSPPFSSLYIYSDSEADLGNSANDEEFFEHYEFIIGELYRTTVVGRLCAVHCKDLPKYANTHGYAGLSDFPGDTVKAFERHGWSFHSRCTIWKCPVTERERTNNNGLLHKTATRDRSQLRQGMADYLLVFRKPPVGTLNSDKPVAWCPKCNSSHVHYVKMKAAQRLKCETCGALSASGNQDAFQSYVGTLDPRHSIEHPSKFARKAKDRMMPSVRIWQRYAEPVWWDIDQTNVLNYKAGRDADDERHICPLQLDVIQRSISLWSNPGDVVFSPFAGVGSEGVGAIREGRRFVGVELKESYFNVAVNNLRQAVKESDQGTLFHDDHDELDIHKHAERGHNVSPVAEVRE